MCAYFKILLLAFRLIPNIDFMAFYQEYVQHNTSRQHNRNRSYYLSLDENKIGFFEVFIFNDFDF